MGIRETLNQNPQITTAATIGIVVIALAVIAYQLVWSGPGGHTPLNQAFFTVDDGESFFVDDIDNLPPFDWHGQMAVRAHVFTCDGGETRFVGYLERYTPAALEAIRKARGEAAGAPDAAADPQAAALFHANLSEVMHQGIEVKRPGDRTWVNIHHPDAVQRIMNVRCPDGQGIPQPVLP